MHNIAVCSAALIAFWWVVQPIRVKAVHSSKSGASAPHQEAMIMKQTFNSNNVFNIVKGQESPCVTPLCHSAWLWRGRGGLCCGLKSDCLVWFKSRCFQSLTFVRKRNLTCVVAKENGSLTPLMLHSPGIFISASGTNLLSNHCIFQSFFSSRLLEANGNKHKYTIQMAKICGRGSCICEMFTRWYGLIWLTKF